MLDLKKRLEEERDRHVAGYPGPRRDVAELLDDALSALTHPAPTHNDGSGEAVAWVSPSHLSSLRDPFSGGDAGFPGQYIPARKTAGGKFTLPLYTRPDHTSGEVTEAGIPKSISDAELSQWAEKRADDAGRLARELVAYRRGSLPQDVINLVIAARIVAFEDQSPEALRSLDEASEAFASRVPWDNAPEGEQ